ncbi:aldehyde dehydrogenase [Mycena olivaceomarginata]|nr:aldehyde dehydrogenase [Mycena olivaceomarginata]
MVQENAPAFTEAVSKDVGKPKTKMYFAEIRSWMIDVSYVVSSTCDHRLISLRDWQKPWPCNYPLILSLQPLTGAIAAGCCAVLKPSEIVPHYSALLSELAPKYLDSNAFKIVLGSVSKTTKLLGLQFFYTGNSRISRIIATAAARHLTPLTLELGGKCPVIVDPATDIAIAAKRILWGKAQNWGQVCMASDYVLVPRTHQDTFIAALQESYFQNFPDGSLASDSISRIHSRLMDLFKRTKGEIVLGGISRSKLLWSVKNISANDSLMEGVFWSDFAHYAIDLMRERHHLSVLYAFTENPEEKTQLLNGTFNGRLVFNDTFQQLAVNELPLGGVGESGHGRQILNVDLPKEYVGPHSCTGRPDHHIRAEPFLGIRYAPYTEENVKIMAAPTFLQIPEKIRGDC